MAQNDNSSGSSPSHVSPATSAQQDVAANVNVKLLLGILVAAAFVVILNETTLTVAMPVLMMEFGIEAGAAQWLITAFMLTMAVVIPMTGFIMQRFTLRSIYIFAMSMFLVGTILAVVSPSFFVLLVARVIQASGTALIMPLLMTSVMRLVPIERRGQVFGNVILVIAVAPALGPTFSGVVLEMLSWRWIFGLMIPLVLLALFFGALQVRNFEEPTRPYLDVPSVVLSAVGFSAALYGISGMSELPNGVPWDRVGVLVVGVVALAIFFRRQAQLKKAEAQGKKQPLLDLSPLRSREYVLSMVLMLLSFSMLFGFIILMPLYAQNVLGMSKLATGLVSMPGGVIMGLMGQPVGRAYDKRGARPLIIPGAILLFVAMLGFANLERTEGVFDFLGEYGPQIHLILLTIVLNIGVGLLLTPLMSNALASVPNELASHGQAILNTFQQVAGGAGTAVFVAIMSFASASYAKSLGLGAAGAPGAGSHGMGSTEYISPEVAKIMADVVGHGIEVAFWVGVAISVLLIICTVTLRIEAQKEHEQA